VQAGNLTTLQGVHLSLGATGTVPTAQMTTFTSGRVSLIGVDHDLSGLTGALGTQFVVDGTQPDLSNLSSIDGVSFFVSGGGLVSLPLVTSYSVASTGNDQHRTFRAEEAGSLLDLSNVTTITNGTNYGARLYVEALTGGEIDLGGVTEITDPSAGDTRHRSIDVTADGVGSVVDLGLLTTYTDVRATASGNTYGRWSTMSARDAGVVRVRPAGTAVQGVHVDAGHEGTIEGSLELLSASGLGGSGVVTMDVLNGALVYPDGTLSIGGSYTQGPAGRLEIDIGGLTPGAEHDVLVVAGPAALDGTFAVALTGGFVPSDGDSFRVMTFASRSGAFAAYEGLDTGAGAELMPELTNLDLTLVAGFSTGPSVAQIAPSDSSVDPTGPFIDVTFSEPVDPDTFGSDDIVIVGPAGPIGFAEPQAIGGATRVYRIQLDIAQFVSGAHDVTIGPQVLDYASNPMNQDGDNINGEPAEDVFQGQVDVLLPDLAPEAIVVDPTSAFFGDEIEVSWTVRNAGASAAGGAWDDEVWLSADAVLDAGDELLATVPVGADSPLGDAGTYDRSISVLLPLTAESTAGTYYLIVQADSGLAVAEGDEANNAAASGPVSLDPPLLPDLDLLQVTAPATGQPGQTVPISWTVKNAGNAAAAGPWVDRVYLSLDGQVPGATLLAWRTRSQDLAADVSYTESIDVALGDLADGDYQVIVVTDAADVVFEGLDQSSNQRAAPDDLAMRHADLAPTIVSAPGTATSVDPVTVQWTTANNGTAATLDGWVDRLYLSTDNQYSGGDRLLGEFTFTGPLDPTGSLPAELTVDLPIEASGPHYLIVLSDAANDVRELAGESDNEAYSAINIQLAPYADLAVLNVDAPTRTIGDPAEVTIGWEVQNLGTGAGETHTWYDAIIASVDAIADGGDIELARFEHTGAVEATGGYTRSETFLLPIGFQGRYHLFVKTDADGAVFENSLEANNTAESDEIFDVMKIPYADLTITSLAVPATAFSGRPMDVTWTVVNQGIGLTSTGNWTDTVYLATDAAGTDRIEMLGRFSHFGHLDVSGSYERTGTVTLPDGLEGDYYVVVVTGGPFEFIHTDNNDAVSDLLPVTLTPPLDLTVTDVLAPATAEEGSAIDVTWTVENIGSGDADGSWVDQVYLRKVGEPDTRVELGKFTYLGPLLAGTSYSRTEHVSLPVHVSGLYEVVVTTDYKGALYEHGATGNNTGATETPLDVTVKPRPDLRVENIDAPAEVDPGATLSVQFTVLNDSAVPTTRSEWIDRAFLSLDTRITPDDILLGESRNQAALGPGESYLSPIATGVVPKRYRGEVYIIIVLDAEGEMDEWPNEDNNLRYQSVYAIPLPLADLVTSDVAAPGQAIDGAEIPVQYTVTNLGSGPTYTDRWTEMIWLTTDKNRPHPGAGDILLKTLEHTGGLDRDAGYDVVTTVQLPTGLVSGTYYVMPWTDPYGEVLEDTLAVNVNPDDPNEIDNNNYKARAIDILGQPPDLVVTQVVPDASPIAGEPFTVTWTVENLGLGPAPGGWVDRVYLSTHADPFAAGAKRFLLGQIRHGSDLPHTGASTYTESLIVMLSPSAAGSHVVVITDYGDEGGAVVEVFEDNNVLAAATGVTPVPADLVVTNVQIEPTVYSGERTLVRYTVQNVGPNPVWAGTQYWRDFIWISADPTFIQGRATYLGQTVHAQAAPLAPGETYDVEVELTLPEGIGGNYFLYIHLDAHNDNSPVLMPLFARSLDTGWWPADSGDNAGWTDHFGRWAFEDPTNNLKRADLPVIYYEADLEISNLIVPAGAESGQTIPISWTVTNNGTRGTRVSAWDDRVFLSMDPSLDKYDLVLGTYHRDGALGIGASYGPTRAASTSVCPTASRGSSTSLLPPTPRPRRLCCGTARSASGCRALTSSRLASSGATHLRCRTGFPSRSAS